MRSAREIGAGRYGMAATLITGMTMAGALAMQARAILQGKDPRNMKDPFFWGESFLQGGAAGIYGDFFKEAFSRSDTSLTESLMGPLAAIPAGIQGLTSGARRMAEDGQHVNFGAKVARLLSQNVVGGNLWYSRLVASRLLFDNIQRLIDRDLSEVVCPAAGALDQDQPPGLLLGAGAERAVARTRPRGHDAISLMRAMPKMDRSTWRRWASRKASAQHENFDGVITYGLACRCGHKGVVRLDQDRAAAATFTCSKCGRKQTRERNACARPIR